MAIIARFLPTYQAELEKAVSGCKSLLDVGCGSCSPIKPFSKQLFSVGVDNFRKSIERSKKQGIHNKYFKIDVLGIGKRFSAGSFDCVAALDLIEHLTKEQGIRLLAMMEKIARKKVIIFTPNGFLQQAEYGSNPMQRHKSGWNVSEMRKRGYRVIGINGWKPLRTENACMRFWPKYFWLFVSYLTQPFVRNRPEKAFQILCVKEK